MFLQLAHTHMDVFQCSKEITISCYGLTTKFPNSEKFGIVQQIRRAALSVHLNFSEGCSRRSKAERRRYFEISRGSLIEVDTALDIALALEYISSEELQSTGKLLVRAFSMLSALMKN